MEANLHRPRVRRAEDHLADRRRLVVDVAEPRLQPLVVEGGRAEQPTSSFGVNRSSMPPCGRFSASTRRVAFEHRRDGRLVVRAEDRAGRVAHDAVLDHRLDRALGRNRVEVRAEEDRVAAVGRFEAAVDVADVRADLRARIVLVDRQPEIAQVADHDVRNRALLARRARERRQLGEKVDDLGGHRSILGGR